MLSSKTNYVSLVFIMQLGIQRQMTFWLLEKVERVLPNVVQKVNREKKGEKYKRRGNTAGVDNITEDTTVGS